MIHFTDTKEIILALKKVYEEKNLSIDKTLALVEEKEGKNVVSRSSIQRIFAKGSEDDPKGFRYETTLKPICNALLDIENDEIDDSADTLAYKSILRYKKEIIDDYVQQTQDLKDEIESIKDKEKSKYAERLAKETQHFNDSLAFMRHQIELKDQRIDELLSGWREMAATNKDLTQTNNQLVKQLMNCPLRIEDKNES